MAFEVHEHYNCRISDITTDHEQLTPTWHRVTQSPWAAKSSKTVGYGRRILRCAVSDDLPTHFVRTEHIKRPEDLKPLPRENFASTASIQASLLLPGAGSTLAPKPTHGNRIKKLIKGNQVFVEPYPTPRNRAEFCKWNSKSPRTSRTNDINYGPDWRSARPVSHQNRRQTQSSTPRIASARSNGRRDGSSSNRSRLFSR